MSEPWSVLIAAAVAAISGAIGSLLTIIHKNKQGDEATTAKSYKAVFDRQEKRIARLESLIDEQRGLIEHMGRDHSTCRVQLAEVYSDLCAMHDTACRHAEALNSSGKSVGSVPPLRPRPSHITAMVDTEFLERTVQHNTILAEATKAGTSKDPKK